MSTPTRILFEAVLVALLGALCGFAGNALSKDGLDLGRDYFAGLRAPPAEPLASSPATTATPAATAPVEGPATAPASAPAGLDEAVAERLRRAGLEPVGREQAKQWFDDPDQATTFVDARNDDHYQAGHIPRAWQFDHYHPDRYVNEILPIASASERVLIYCYGKDCVDSELVAQDLISLGIPAFMVVVYVGGFSDWASAGFPIERGARGSGDVHAGTSDDGN